MLDKVIIVVMNGVPTSGKTTIQHEIVRRYDESLELKSLSSVDKMYQCMRILGWDGTTKDDDFRNEMAMLKQIYIRRCDGPTHDVITAALDMKANGHSDAGIIFYDCRERDQIEHLQELVGRLDCIGIFCKTVLVRRRQVECQGYGNDADQNVLTSGFKYDIEFDNSGTMSQMENQIDRFVNMLLEV